MRGKRKQRGTWFPILGVGLNEGADSCIGTEFQLSVPSLGESVSQILPITYDDPRDDDEASDEAFLSDFLGNEYVIDRIVGHWFVSRRISGNANDVSPEEQPPTLVTCGLFVSRSQDAGGGTLDSQPIGAGTEAEIRKNYSPISENTIREPWMWRRSWILGTNGVCAFDASSGAALILAAGAAVPPTVPWGVNHGQAWPASNSGYGSLSDGPRLDVKSKRRVRQDERLWAIMTVCNWPLDSQLGGATQVSVYSHIMPRIYGRLRKPLNRSSF